MADTKFNVTSITTFYTYNKDFTNVQKASLFNVMKTDNKFQNDVKSYENLKGVDYIAFYDELGSYRINEQTITSIIDAKFYPILQTFCKCICSIKFQQVDPGLNETDKINAFVKNTETSINQYANDFDIEKLNLFKNADKYSNEQFGINLYPDIYDNLIDYIFKHISDMLILMYTYDLKIKKLFILLSWILISFNNTYSDSFRAYINVAYESENVKNKLFVKCIYKMYNFLINIYNESYYNYLIDLDPHTIFGQGDFEGYGERKNKSIFQNMIKTYSNKYSNMYNIKPKQICEMFFSSLVTSMISNDDNNIDKINKKINNYLSDKNFNDEIDDYKLHLENNITRLESKCSNYSFYDSDRE